MSLLFANGRLTLAGRTATLLVSIGLAPLIAALALAALVLRFVYGRLLLSGAGRHQVAGGDARAGQECDSPNSMINGGTFVECEVDVDVFRRHVENACVRATDLHGRKLFPKLTQTLHRRAGYLVWRDDPNFKMENHVYGLHLSTSGQQVRTQQELESLLNRLFNRMLPEDRPVWEFAVIHLAPDWRASRRPHDLDAIPRSVIAIHFHHSIMDGMTLSRFCSEIVSSSGANVPAAMQRMLPLWKPKRQHPVVKKMLKVATWAATFPYMAYIFIQSTTERDNTFLQRTPPTKRKLYAWSNPLSLDRIKAIKSATGTTVNDVLMSSVAAAVSRYFDYRREWSPPTLQSVMSISLQRLDKPIRMRNDILTVFLPLCTTHGLHPLARLGKTRAYTSIVKSSPSATLQGILVPFMCHLMPVWMVRGLCGLSSPSVIYSNVPGPDIPIHIASDRIVQLMAISPNFCANGLSFSCISYLKSVTVALAMDSGISADMQDARAIIGYVEEELERLAAALQLRATEPISKNEHGELPDTDDDCLKERTRFSKEIKDL